MDWTPLGTRNFIPVVSNRWERFPIGWLDYPGQQSLIKVRFNFSYPSKILAEGIKKFLVRQFFPEIPGVSTSISFYPEAYDVVIFLPPAPFNYSIEIAKVAYRKNLISEPPYSISVYASRINL